jgi:hypothetical protein
VGGTWACRALAGSPGRARASPPRTARAWEPPASRTATIPHATMFVGVSILDQASVMSRTEVRTRLHGALRHPVPRPRWCRPPGAIRSLRTEVPAKVNLKYSTKIPPRRCNHIAKRLRVQWRQTQPEDAGLGWRNAVDQARADLAARLGIAEETVGVVSITADEFPASNLGCGEFSKQPDRPIPALLTGQRIVLAAGGRRYLYHAHRVHVAYCGSLGD